MPRLVLVADDSPTHQRRASGILTGEGLEVLTVSNGVAAIKKLPSINPALVLADVAMPGRDGYEVCEFVKNTPELAHVPVLLIFSELEPCDEARARRAGADGRVKKPFGQEELVAVVNKFITQAEAAPPPPPKPVIVPAPPLHAEVEPVDLPPEASTRMELPDFGALSEGTPFGEAGPAEAPSPAIAETPSPWQVQEEAPAAPPPAAVSSEELSASAEPQLVEEPAGAPTPAEEEPPERTMMFRMPVEIAQPVLADDLAPAPPVDEAPVAAPPEAPAAERELAEEAIPPHEQPAEEAISPQPPPEPEAPAPAPAEAAPPPPSPPFEAPEAAVEEPPAPAPEPAPEVATTAVAAVDTDLIYWIVHNVVVRMAPPALTTSAVEELIRQISDEMITELSQPPPESQG
ncbi:MAG: response regulator [Terriglobia bacterium]